MAHMQFDARIKEALKLDSDLPRVSRMQKKTEPSGSKSFCENSFAANKSMLGSSMAGHSASFADGKMSPSRGISPGRSKSPGRVLTKLSVRTAGPKTPSRKTPNKHGDRFIPSRSSTDFERSHQLLVGSVEKESKDDEESLKRKEYREKMMENLNDGAPPADRVLSFTTKAPEPKDGHMSATKVLYSATKATKTHSTRHIPSEPEKVLDAPELRNDYYLHLLDWSINNHLAVALGSSVFIWNGSDGSISSLCQYEEPLYISSVSWMKEGNILAIGLSDFNTQLWDVGQNKLLRTMGGHTDRVSSLSWNSHILSSGSKSGKIINHDVRVADHVSATLSHHSQEVCGLKWSLDGNLLASGGNDNLLNVWDKRSSSLQHTFTQHEAAVKALAWCPWQGNFLASGGGTTDRTIRLWNCSLGSCINSVDAKSQVSSLLWSSHYKELISGHGYAQNQLTIWRYPSFERVVDLKGHSGRVLELCLSPDGETVMSAAADETLRLWKCWAVDKHKKSATGSTSHPISALTKTIR